MIRDLVRSVRRYGRDVRLVLAVSAMLSFTVDGVFPVIFNLYILRMGYGPEFVGQANSVALVVFSLASLPAGTLGTRFGARRVMVSGVVISLLSTWALTLSDSLPAHVKPWWIMGIFSLLYLGVAFYFVNSSPALVNALPASERSRVISVQSALNNFLAFVGGPVAGFIPVLLVSTLGWPIHDPATYRVPLLVAGILLVVATALILAARTLDGHKESEAEGEPAAPTGAPTVAIAFGSTLLIMSIIRFLTTAGSGSALTFFNVYMDDALSVPTSTIGLVVALAHLIAVFGALSVPALTRRLGNGPAAVVATVGVALSMIPLGLIPLWPAAGAGFMAMYALTSVRYSAFFVYMMDVTPPRLRTTMAGVGEFAGGLSFALASLLGGYAIVRLGYDWLFVGAGLVTAAGAVMLWLYIRWRARQPVYQTVPEVEIAG